MDKSRASGDTDSTIRRFERPDGRRSSPFVVFEQYTLFWEAFALQRNVRAGDVEEIAKTRHGRTGARPPGTSYRITRTSLSSHPAVRAKLSQVVIVSLRKGVTVAGM